MKIQHNIQLHGTSKHISATVLFENIICFVKFLLTFSWGKFTIKS